MRKAFEILIGMIGTAAAAALLTWGAMLALDLSRGGGAYSPIANAMQTLEGLLYAFPAIVVAVLAALAFERWWKSDRRAFAQGALAAAAIAIVANVPWAMIVSATH